MDHILDLLVEMNRIVVHRQISLNFVNVNDDKFKT
jgi:hypothetical protein